MTSAHVVCSTTVIWENIVLGHRLMWQPPLLHHRGISGKRAIIWWLYFFYCCGDWYCVFYGKAVLYNITALVIAKFNINLTKTNDEAMEVISWQWGCVKIKHLRILPQIAWERVCGSSFPQTIWFLFFKSCCTQNLHTFWYWQNLFFVDE